MSVRSRCTVCASEHREAVERAVTNGAQVRLTALSHGLSESSLRRHLATHLAEDLQLAARNRDELQAGAVLDRLVEMELDAAVIKESAMTTGSHRVALLALAEQRATLTVIADRLGVDDVRIAAAINNAKGSTQAMGMLARAHPEIADELAEHMRACQVSPDWVNVMHTQAEVGRAQMAASAPARGINEGTTT